MGVSTSVSMCRPGWGLGREKAITRSVTRAPPGATGHVSRAQRGWRMRRAECEFSLFFCFFPCFSFLFGLPFLLFFSFLFSLVFLFFSFSSVFSVFLKMTKLVCIRTYTKFIYAYVDFVYAYIKFINPYANFVYVM